MRGSEVKAKAVATIVATTCAYFLNRHWTYRDRPKTTLRREYSLFFFFNAVRSGHRDRVRGVGQVRLPRDEHHRA